ncbi:MAG: hypothetical protein MJ179_04620 [Treponema sp.]|nr:hypothetical protein [Treponema sp.]
MFTGCDILGLLFFGGSGSENNVTKQYDLSDKTGTNYLIQINNTFYEKTSAQLIVDEGSRNAYEDSLSSNDEHEDDSSFFINDTSLIKRYIENTDVLSTNSRAVSSSYVTSEVNDNNPSSNHKSFYVLAEDDYGNEKFIKSTAELVKSNNYCNIWFIEKEKEKSISGIILTSDNNIKIEKQNVDAKANCALLAEKFAKLLPEEEKYFGSHEYKNHIDAFIPAQKKIDIIVYDILNDSLIQKQNGYIAGYFSPNDYLTQDYQKEYNTSIAASGKTNYLYANSTQAIYIDSAFLATNPNQSYSTLLHEYAHLLEHTNKIITNENPNINGKKEWFSEMLAMLAEDLLNDYIGLPDSVSPTNRIPKFLLNYNRGFTSWNKSENILIYYANTYVYGAYLIRNYGGINLLDKIIKNPYFGEQSINDALRGSGFSFDDTVSNEWQIFFPGQGFKYSLNKSITPSSTTEYKFKAININDYITNNQATAASSNKALEKNIISDRNTRKYINPQGFMITYLGKDLDSVITYGSSSLEYKVIEIK